jgi:hypothetical protein
MTDSAQPRLAIIGGGAVVQHHLVPALSNIVTWPSAPQQPWPVGLALPEGLVDAG